MKLKSSILFLILFFIVILACEYTKEPQARLEEEEISCPIDLDFKAMVKKYFEENHVPPASIPKGKNWHRAIVIRKDRLFTKEMIVSFTLITESLKIRILRNSAFSDAAAVNQKVKVGSDIFFRDVGADDYISQSEIEIIRERALCIPENAIPKNNSLYTN